MSTSIIWRCQKPQRSNQIVPSSISVPYHQHKTNKQTKLFLSYWYLNYQLQGQVKFWKSQKKKKNGDSDTNNTLLWLKQNAQKKKYEVKNRTGLSIVCSVNHSIGADWAKESFIFLKTNRVQKFLYVQVCAIIF